MNSSAKYALIAGLALTSVSLLYKSRTAAIESNNKAAIASGPSESSLLHPVAVGYSWNRGDRASYDVTHVVTMRGESKEWNVDGQSTSLNGQLHFAVLDTAADGVSLACQGEDIVVTTEGKRDATKEALLNGVAQVLRWDAQGKLLSRSFPQSLPTEDRRFLAGLTQMQWVLGAGTSWTTKEADSLGSYLCQYSKDEKSGAMRKNRRLEAIPGSEKLAMQMRVLESNFTATRGGFWLNSLEGVEKIAMTHEGKVVLTLESTIQLKLRTGGTSLPRSLGSLSAAEVKASFKEEPLSSGLMGNDPDSEKKRLAKLREKYGEMPYDQVFAQLRDAVAKAKSHADTLAAIEAMRDWLEVHPDEAGKVANSLRDNALPDGLTSRLTHALELAGRAVPQAQEALGEIMLHRAAYPENAVLQAVVASGDVGELRGTKLFEGLKDILANPLSADKSDDFLFSDAALYSVGRLAEGNPEAKTALLAALEPRLKDPSSYSASDLVTALQSLANGRVAEASLLEASQTLETHADPSVRAAVVDYRHRAYPEDTRVAMNALADPSDVVQASGVAALADPETATEASMQALRAQLNKADLLPQTRDAISNALEQRKLLANE